VPTGTESRRPLNRSAAATQIRESPWRRYNCALSPVASRSEINAGAANTSKRSSPAAEANSEERAPKIKRPEKSRETNL
jgi:hypothetical protein